MTKSRTGALATAILVVAAYAGGAILLRYVVAAVAGAVDQMRASGTISGDQIAEAMADPSPAHRMAAILVADALAIAWWWSSRSRGSVDVPASSGRVLWAGLLFSAGLVVTGLAATQWFGGTPLPTFDQEGLSASWWVLLAILHPLAAELVFRSTALGHMLESGMAAGLAIVLQAVLFCLVAPTLTTAGLALLFGLVAGWVRVRTGTVGSAVTLHYLLFCALALSGMMVVGSPTDAGHVLLLVIGLGAAVAGAVFLLGAKPAATAAESES